MGTLHLLIYSCLRLLFPDVETNPGIRRPVPDSCRILYSNVRVCPETLVIWPWLHLSMIYYCALRPWAQICVTCQSCWFLGSVALSSCAGPSCLVPVGWRHMYEMDMEHFTNENLSVVVVKCWLLGFVVYDRTYMCIVFTVILTKMTAYVTIY